MIQRDVTQCAVAECTSAECASGCRLFRGLEAGLGVSQLRVAAMERRGLGSSVVSSMNFVLDGHLAAVMDSFDDSQAVVNANFFSTSTS